MDYDDPSLQFFRYLILLTRQESLRLRLARPLPQRVKLPPVPDSAWGWDGAKADELILFAN